MLKKKDALKNDLSQADGRNELEKAVLVKMKSVTGASDEVCVSMLENNKYDLKTSIEAYFQSK